MKYYSKLQSYLSPRNFLIAGLLCLMVWGVHFTLQLGTISLSGALNTNSYTASQMPSPVKIRIPSLDISLPIDQTAIKNGEWQISKTGISFLTTSSRPGEGGNGILYGHNTKDRFAKIKKLKIGSMIYIESEDGSLHAYKVTKIITVKPDNIKELLDHTGDTITLYTCTGFADSKRLIVKAQKTTLLQSSLLTQ